MEKLVLVIMKICFVPLLMVAAPALPVLPVQNVTESVRKDCGVEIVRKNACVPVVMR